MLLAFIVSLLGVGAIAMAILGIRIHHHLRRKTSRIPRIEHISVMPGADASASFGPLEPEVRTPNLKKLAAALLLFILVIPATSYAQEPSSQTEEIRQLRQLVTELQARLDRLEKTGTNEKPAGAAVLPSQPAAEVNPVTFLGGTTVNFLLDGNYIYNFNQPIGRVNLLRAYDVGSNSFTINQAAVIFENAPDVAAGKRWGARLDLQFGQATETVQGGAQNELRPQVYRNVFQAYGTYVAPLGKGLTVDFGKWASSLGIEATYAKDQMNYSRSYWFNFLPYYHMGFRVSYPINDKLTLGYMLVNGAQQSEDFNGFKSQHFQAIVKPTARLTWTANYYFGQEQRDVVAVLNPGFPTIPSQPGLPTTNISPAPDGRLHVLDSYFTWNATDKLTLAAEGDYVINRTIKLSDPQVVTGGAAYARYQFTSKTALAGRFAYLGDHGGLFSGIHQALKDFTFTHEYKFAEGFMVRSEFRRDFSNQAFFLTDIPSRLKKEQNTATLGLLWWFGGKKGSY
jgi:hypothetical protein